jgi:hypothetical protein
MKTYSQHTKTTNGFAHLVLIFVVFIIAAAVVYFVIMGSKSDISDSLSNLYAKPSPQVTMAPTPVELDKQLDEIPDDSDPSSDLNTIDSDINSL